MLKTSPPRRGIYSNLQAVGLVSPPFDEGKGIVVKLNLLLVSVSSIAYYNENRMENGAIEILKNRGCLYMKDDYKALFEELEAYYKQEKVVKNNCDLPVVSESFNSLIDRLEKCFNADPQEQYNVFNREEAINGWKNDEKELHEFVKEKESELNVL